MFSSCLDTSLLLLSLSFHSRAPYISAMASMPEPDITAQLVQLVTSSKGMSSPQSYWPPGGYTDPQYAYSYAAQYGYTQPVSLFCCVCVEKREGREEGGGRGRGREREREREGGREGEGEREGERGRNDSPPHTSTQVMPPSSYMFSPGAQPTSATPTFTEDLEDPNPPIDPETMNREFYKLDKVNSL